VLNPSDFIVPQQQRLPKTSENHVNHVGSPMSKPPFLKAKVINVSFINANGFNSSMATTNTFPRGNWMQAILV